MNAYTPRRCSKRWLDGDCPRDILAILDHPNYTDRYTVIYADMQTYKSRHTSYVEQWLTYLASDSNGAYYHGEMRAHEVAAYRYHNKHRYARWTDLPEAVRNTVRRDIAEAARYLEENAK